MKLRNLNSKSIRNILIAFLTIFIFSAKIFAATGIDSTFNTNALSYNVEVEKIDVYPEGKILVVQGTSFDRVNGIKRNGFARLNADGSLDESFNPNNNGIDYRSVYAVKALPNGKALLGGTILNADGTTRAGLIRLNNDGTVDTSFQFTGGLFYSIEIQPDGKIVVAGFFSTTNGGRGVARLNEDGSLDTTFRADVGFTPSPIAVLPNGKIVVATATPKSGTWFYRLNSNGSLDVELPRYGSVTGLRALSDGKLLVNANGLRRLNADGSEDSTFTRLSGTEGKILLTGDNKILVFKGGSLFRLHPDGTIDPTFVYSSNITNLRNFALQPDGRIIIAGKAPPLAPPAVPRPLLRLLQDGSLDPSFAPIFSVDSGVVRNVIKIAPLSDGKVLVLGDYLANNGETQKGVVRLNADGTRDAAFTPFTSARVNNFELQTNGKILVTGSSVDGSSKIFLEVIS